MFKLHGKRRAGFSLKYRIAAIIFVLEALMMASVLSVTLKYSTDASSEQLYANEQVILGLLADVSRIALLTAEYDDLQPYIEKIVADPHIDTIVLSDYRGRVVVSTEYELIGEPSPELTNDDTRRWFSHAIANESSKLGSLAMRFSHAGLKKTNREILNLGITIALTGMTIIAVVGIAIGFLLTRRLDIVSATAQRMAAGDFTVRTELVGSDEVAVLGQTFDHMADSVSDSMAALREMTEELEQRVALRTAQLAEARDEAISADRSKSAFLANMSHEIRTPLTAIIGFSESLRDAALDPEERASLVETIIRSGRHLLGVINDILDLSKIEADKLEVERIPCNLFELLADVESVLGMQARDKGLSVSIDYDFPIPKRIETDPTRLKQILLNLCSNAIKFTEQGGVRIEVRCHLEEQQLSLSVIDTGIGMSPEQQSKMFERFSQADASSTRRYGGTGLGLYICKQLSELLGGSIRLQSLEGVGTRVDVVIATGPIDLSDLCNAECLAQSNSKTQAILEPTDLSGRVLLAEDSPDNQRLISMYVRKTGAEIVLADNGREAVEQALAGDYDLVLMDMQMPVMDGMEATQWLRKAGYGGPIVALTANVMKEERDRYTSAGCDAFLGKPIETSDFYHVLARYLPRATVGRVDGHHQTGLLLDADLLPFAEEFIEHLPERLDNMRRICEQADWCSLAEEAHKLKGIAGGVGFPAITESAANIERQVKDDNHALLPELLADLMAMCERAEAELRLYTATQSEAQA